MQEWNLIPVEVMTGCFIALGFIVLARLRIDWIRVF